METDSVPGKVKENDMKRILAHIAVSAIIPMTLALVACGDEKTSSAIDVGSTVTSLADSASNVVDQEMPDSSDNESDTNTVSQESDSISVESDSASSKTVLANSGPCSLNRTNGGDLAYLTNNEKVGYQIIIPDVSAIGYYTNKELKAERIGDTLEVMYPSDTIAILDWICYVYYTFNIPEEDADVKYLKYIRNVYKVVPGPAPEKAPDTSCHRIPPLDKPFEEGVYDSTFCIIATFTPSAEGVYDSTWTVFPYDIYQSSSSISAKSSSSSAANVAGTHQVITDATGQCQETVRGADPLLDGASLDTVSINDGKVPPVAYRYVGAERTGFTLENISLSCGVVVDTLDANVSGDTVHVKAKFDRSNAMRCPCNFEIKFAVENNEAYALATVLSIEGATGEPFFMEIIDMDVITVEEMHQFAKDIAIECKNDRQTLNRPMLSKTTFAPDFDTTSTKHIAGRVVGDDGFDMILINELDIGCGVENVNFEVSASNDTLYVQPSAGLFGTNCICPSRINFKIEQNSRFSNTNVLVFGHFEPMPLVTTVPVTFRPVRQE